MTAMGFDLGIEGGTVVTAQGRQRAHVYVQGERVAAVTDQRHAAKQRADASGLLVMPGMVDAHVHLMDPADCSREDFPTGTAAAAVAGVTTILEHTHGQPVTTVAELAEKRAYLQERARVDFALAAHAQPDRPRDVGALWDAGVAFIKAFTCTTHGVQGHAPAQLMELFREVAMAGATCLVHCEDESLTSAAERSLRALGRKDGGVIPLWRHRNAELVAVVVTALLARQTRARVVIAHASCPEVLDLVERERATSRLYVESCPQYLTLLEHEVLAEAALRKFTPPARAHAQADLDAMWGALAEGRIDYVASDHAPATLMQKRGSGIWEAPFGLPGLDTTLPVLLDAAARGRLSYERLVAVYAEGPARIYGLAPRKGFLCPGADADIVLIDPEARWTVADDDIISRAKWSPYRGRTLTGHAVATYVRGRLVARERQIIGEPGSGRFLPGQGARGGGAWR